MATKTQTVDEEIDLDGIRRDPEYRDKLRWRAQTDLYWLATKCLVEDDGSPCYPNISEATHQEVARFFVRKNPSRSIADQDDIKQRLLLMPRGTFKTTFNIVDALQWILAFPDIRMLVLTAANTDDSPLADQFLEEVTRHFMANDEGVQKPLHVLFPEYVITKKAKKGWFVSPARKKYDRAPTLMATSIESSLSGWHFDVTKLEDIQDNRNSQTAAAINKVRRNMFINLKMLMPWGYREATATRYGPMDVYGHIIERLNPKVGKVLWKPAMKVKEAVWRRRPDLVAHAEDYDFLIENLEPRDWELFFPEFLSFEKLMSDREEDPDSFMTQYMNVATGNFKPIFPPERLNLATLDEERLPITGSVHIAWRLETAESKNICGVAGIQHAGRMYVMDLERGNWTPSTQVLKIIAMAKRNHAHRIAIEETPGARHMETAIRNEALKQGWELSINWLAHEGDTKERELRIKSMEPVLITNRLFFSRELRLLKLLHRQMYHYGMSEDIEVPDVISRVCEALPKMVGDSEAVAVADDVAWEAIRARAQRERVFSQGNYAPLELEEDAEGEQDDWSPLANEDGLTEIMPGLTG